MKNTFYSICLLAITLVVFPACKKDGSVPTSTAPNFGPLTTGSSWTYKYSEGSSSSGTFKTTATNRDTVANGKTFKVLSNSDGSSSYLAKIGNDYFRFASFPSIGINNFEELYLKDNKAVNETWTGSATFKYSGQTITATLNYTIKGKGESRTVSAKVYNNVTRVRLDIFVFGSGVGGGDFYYQEGVGLIEANILVTPPFGQPYTSKQEILSYEIK